MITDFNRTIKLLISILICLILLTICIAYDTADETITAKNDKLDKNLSNGVVILNGTYVSLDKNSGQAISDGKIHTVKPKYKTITMTGKPSCTKCTRNGCAYTWRTKTYKNYCPNCHHYGTLGNKHKWQSRHGQEISCFRCDSDFCINCGKEKYSWSQVYLRKA